MPEKKKKKTKSSIDEIIDRRKKTRKSRAKKKAMKLESPRKKITDKEMLEHMAKVKKQKKEEKEAQEHFNRDFFPKNTKEKAKKKAMKL